MKPSASDYERLRGINARLAAWVEECFRLMGEQKERWPRCRIRVTEGLRDIETQRRYLEIGASQTLQSRHLTGHAVDLVVQSYSGGRWVPRWEWQVYERFAKMIGKPAAENVALAVTWGGDWQSLKDGVHWEIDPEVYY